MSQSAGGTPRFTNRLVHESSPYLLQHAHNPVDWHPWGPEAFEIARKEDKPIFLSVGYSTCYWCHVMERQSFENETVAAEMNRLMVNIKVDREERPDVDQLYMTAVQVQTRQGGWPMSVFLLPDLRYFYGGTYFPPTDAYGRPGFVTLIRAIADAYRNRRSDVDQTATQFLEILKQAAQPPSAKRRITIDQEFIARLVERSAGDYDAAHGGFGGAPKFPRETLLEMLLMFQRAERSNSKSEISDSKSQSAHRQSQIANRKSQIHPILHSLDAMANGGIRDQLGGGFHRYSTDAHWLVPHFEIMLYDNAMLGWCYAEAFAQTAEQKYATIARGIFDFVLREMTSPQGAFYTAFDAEVDAQEGLSYLWTSEEIAELLGAEDAALFNRVYGVDAGPNFADPHHGSGVPDYNILFLPKPLPQVAAELRIEPDALDAKLAPMRQKLYEARLKRKQPLLDTKIITSWNALMVRALAHAGKTLAEPRYVEAAQRAAMFLLDKHRMSDGRLYRTSREGRAKHGGFLDDYAFLAQSLLALAHVTGDTTWTDRARDIASIMQQKFADPVNGGFFFTEAGAPDMLVRQKTATDSPLPSGNAVAAMVCMELSLPEPAAQTIRLFAPQLEDYGEGMSSMVQAALLYVSQFGEITVEPGRRTSREESPELSAPNAVSISTNWRGARELEVSLAIAEPFHINAHEVGDVGIPLIATNLVISGGPQAIVEYPPGEQRSFAFGEKPIAVYSGTVTLRVKFIEPPTSNLTLRINYQACTEEACLAQATKQITISPMQP
ncbi:MAG TPA: DUF255 domain-containing protein [Humisphaera sp.]|nr:DUF255 domain-containing protein [Humisphaera sp.]